MIPVYEPLLDGNETKYVLDCLETNWISSLGKYILLFEEKVAAYCAMPYAVSCSNCTVGMHMAFVAMGIGIGDEVIIPDFTLIASANTVIQAGAQPVLVDVDPQTWCIDPAKIEAKITPRTKAIMVVHMYGHPCDMPAIMELARRYNIPVIEDCAEAHGAEIDGKRVGGWGDVSVFSFYGNKIITTGEGGMVLCQDKELAERLKLLRNQGFQEPRFVHEVVAYNYRLTNLQAAVGVAQMERIEEKVALKRWIAQTYDEFLVGQEGITRPYEAPNAKSVYWMYGVVVDFGSGKEEVMAQLKAKGVDTRAFFCPMHMQPVFVNGDDPRYPDINGHYPVSIHLWERGFYLPSGMTLTRAQIEEVCSKLLECRDHA